MKKVKVSLIANYGGHSTKPNGIVELNMKTRYSELTKSIQILQMLNENIKVKVKTDEVLSLGVFTLNSINFDHDGGSTIRLKSNIDNAESNNINDLAHYKEELKFLFEADIEEADEEEEDGE